MKKFILSPLLLLLMVHPLYPVDSLSARSPYSLSWNTDGWIVGTGIVSAFAASAVDESIPILTLNEINALEVGSVNPFDRFSAGNYSHNQSKISDVLVGGTILSPLLFVFDSNIRDDAGSISLMYLETVLFASFTPSYGKGSAKRIRPFVYNRDAPLSEKQDQDARRSFFSGHATWAFATSIFFASVYTDYHPDSEYKDYIWGGAVGLASAVSILRVTSGAHFVSDVLVGAAVGSTIGYVIPYLHRNNAENFSMTPMIGSDYRGVSFSLRLK